MSLLLLYCQVSGVVNAEYELEYLLLEGHCFDLSTGQPPRGLQFTLGMRQEPLMHDTIVMANLVSLFSLLCFLLNVCCIYCTWSFPSLIRVTWTQNEISLITFMSFQNLYD